MDQLFEAISILRSWRLLVCLVVSVVVSVVLAHAFSWFTGGVGLGLVFASFGFGLLWHSRADVGLPLLAPVPAPPVSKPVAALGMAFIGFFWGGLLSVWAGSTWVGAVVLAAAPFVVSALRVLLLKRPSSAGYLAFAACSLMLGFVALLALRAAYGGAF